MLDVRTYVISIVAASLISSVAIGITNKMGIIGMLTKLLTGLFLAFTILSPVHQFPSFNLSQYYHGIVSDTEEIVKYGQVYLDTERAQFIKGRSEAYILSKAASLGVELEVDITLSDISPNAPASITIYGDASPYLKQKLQQIITNDLGIQEANQVWL